MDASSEDTDGPLSMLAVVLSVLIATAVVLLIVVLIVPVVLLIVVLIEVDASVPAVLVLASTYTPARCDGGSWLRSSQSA